MVCMLGWFTPHGLVVMTRNISGFKPMGVPVHNSWC